VVQGWELLRQDLHRFLEGSISEIFFLVYFQHVVTFPTLARSMEQSGHASSIQPEVEPMKARKIITVAVAALVALSVSATAFAAGQIRLKAGTQTQSGTRTQTQTKSGTCVK
jgi:hypothetical protein